MDGKHRLSLCLINDIIFFFGNVIFIFGAGLLLQ